MLELIFQGFFEWIYSLVVEIWEFIADGLLDIMSLDFAYLQTHVPIIPQMSKVILAAGWALLLGNLVFQALKSMAAGLGFEGEDPKLLFSRTFAFAFLLLASPQICQMGLELTSNIMDLLSLPNATDVELVNEGIFGSLTAAWLMAMICSVIVMFKVLGLVIEVAERYVILAMLTICAPLAFAMGGSKNTASIFSGWCRMFGSMCLLMVTNLVCCKMLFSVVSTVPSGLDVLPWMVLIFAIVKVAKKSDAIITRIGLNPAITGGPGRTLPGMLAYTVIRTAASQVVKGIGGGGSGGKTTRTASSGGRPGGTFGGGRFFGGGGRFGSAQTPGGGTRGGGRYSSHSAGSTQQASAQQASSQQSGASHGTTQQANTRQENTSRSTTQQASAASATSSNSSRTSQSSPRGPQGQQTRRSSVPPGARRSPSHVPPTPGAAQTSGGPNAQTPPGQAAASTAQRPSSSRPGAAGTTVPKGGAFDASTSRSGAAGTQARNTAPKRPNAPRPSQAGTASTGSGPTPQPGPAGTQARSATSTQANSTRPGPAGTAPKATAPKPPNAAQSGPAGTGASRQSARSTHSASHTVGGSTVNSTSQTSGQTNVTVGRGSSGPSAPQAAAAPRTPHPGSPAVAKPGPDQGKTRTTRRENPGAGPKTPAAPAAPGVSQPGPAGKPARSTQRPPDSATRLGRNLPPATAAPPAGGTASSPARQERVSSSSRGTASGTSPGPAPQEPRKPNPPTSPSMRGGAPNVRPGPAGTAPTGKQAAGQARTAKTRMTRAKPVHRPPPRSKGGTGHG